MKVLIIVILSFIIFQVYGQVDGIEKQILNYGDSKSVIISKGRNLLLDKFLENDMEKVKEIKNYLIKTAEDENYIAFYPDEYWLILYWTNEYEELLNSIMAFNSTASYDTRIRPPQDMLRAKLRLNSGGDALKIVFQIQFTDLDTEKKKLLRLNFENLIYDESYQDTLNEQADIFLKTYPETVYKDFVQKYLRYKFVPKNWGVTFEFFTGYSVNTGKLIDNYTNNIPVGVAFDICYKRFELYLRDYIGFNKTKKDIDYSSGTFAKGSSTMVFLPEASLGYVILDNNRFKLSPFAGIGAMHICPPLGKTEKIPELNEVSITSVIYPIGINFDIKFGKEDYKFRPKSSYGFLRVRYAYNIARFQKKYDGISGNMHYITIGIGAMGRGLKREY